jgi:hypothetical protein
MRRVGSCTWRNIAEKQQELYKRFSLNSVRIVMTIRPFLSFPVLSSQASPEVLMYWCSCCIVMNFDAMSRCRNIVHILNLSSYASSKGVNGWVSQLFYVSTASCPRDAMTLFALSTSMVVTAIRRSPSHAEQWRDPIPAVFCLLYYSPSTSE